MAKRSLKLELEVPKDGGGTETETRTVEALPLTLDQTLSLMEDKAVEADGSPVMLPAFDRAGKPTGQERAASVLDVAPWTPVAVVSSRVSLDAGLRVVRYALRKHPDLADRPDLGAIVDVATTAEIVEFALTAANLLKKSAAQGEA